MQDAIERRFDRIETALETMAKGMASMATDSHSAFCSLNATQRILIDKNGRAPTRMDRWDIDFHALFEATGK